DLGPRPFIAFAPRVVRQDKPAVQAQAVGCLTRARPGREDGLGGGAGGRYGGRGGGKGIAMARFGEAPSGTRSWLLQQQSADGSLPDAAGNADLEGTALLMLSLLGDGNTLRGGPFTEPLSRGIGWLLDQQDDDGRFGQRGPDEVRLHALATYVMAEAFGLSIAWPLRPALQDGLAWLGAHRQADGGFGDGTTSDCMSTATALMALASAEFFAQEPPARPAEVIAWFDTQPAADKLTTAETAATLFCRFFAGQEPKSTPSMVAAAKLLGAKARTDEPWEAYWTSYALFQVGGGDWKAWSKRLQGIADARLTDGEFAGSWEPAGGHSRIVTGALRLLSLQAYYRYTKLVR
ncbi:MAG: terpene cyclase/mutase family protein, partial [Planctomycetes bacterium]|nr:terpene cyclase/mutase family protein [Planctomycetota bacterium]